MIIIIIINNIIIIMMHMYGANEGEVYWVLI